MTTPPDKLICAVLPCYNESGNIAPLYERITAAFATIPDQRYTLLFIDNASTDSTVAEIKQLAARDSRVSLIVNARNFGVLRSGLHGFLSAPGDALITMVTDLQDPPEMIPAFVNKWREGFKVVIGIKPESRENRLMFLIRRAYYKLIGRLSEVPLIENFTGFGLYDREVVEQVRATGDRYPYFRGLIADLGYPRAEIPFIQPRRERGVTSNNFYSLYDLAMLGITSHSKVPLRLATMAGFCLSAISLLVALGYLAAKLLFWYRFPANTAPILIAVFFFASVQLFFIGILGEYIGVILTHVTKRPLVIEKERVGRLEVER
ncbi:glycosyl hydrolase [Acidocella aquatica]|uniref:Glycosyl hydrolase n=1 Tax=Acidocella aquatica TaxID=1922313 RepID=A0ABQ6AB70_9PROT|nr:glycosyltransferase family 2 protein [Acidocella aquatica]GLR67310.1 glycosyl hydrolase [Acidocella aquatica]